MFFFSYGVPSKLPNCFHYVGLVRAFRLLLAVAIRQAFLGFDDLAVLTSPGQVFVKCSSIEISLIIFPVIRLEPCDLGRKIRGIK